MFGNELCHESYSLPHTLQHFWGHKSSKMMFGLQDSTLHQVRGPVTTLKEEPLGAAAHNLHQAARSWMQPAIGMDPHGG